MSKRPWLVFLIVLVLLIVCGAGLIAYRRASIPTEPPEKPLTTPEINLLTVPSTALTVPATFPGAAAPTGTFTASPAQPNAPDLALVTSSVPTPSPAPTLAPPEIPPVLIVVELQTESPTPGGQIVWIWNRSDDNLDLGCWALHSTATGLTVIVEPDLQIPAGAAAILIPQEAWLGVTDRVQLLDRSRNVIDQTPELRDDVFDDQLWFRNTNGEWKFGRTRFDMRVVQGHISTQMPSGC